MVGSNIFKFYGRNIPSFLGLRGSGALGPNNLTRLAFHGMLTGRVAGVGYWMNHDDASFFKSMALGELIGGVGLPMSIYAARTLPVGFRSGRRAGLGIIKSLLGAPSRGLRASLAGIGYDIMGTLGETGANVLSSNLFSNRFPGIKWNGLSLAAGALKVQAQLGQGLFGGSSWKSWINKMTNSETLKKAAQFAARRIKL